MPVPDIILNPPDVLITLSSSPSGLVPYKAGFQIGYVESVYDTSDSTTVGQYVMFDINNSKAFIYGSTIYYKISEQEIFFKENPPP